MFSWGLYPSLELEALVGFLLWSQSPAPSDALSLTPRVGAVLIELALPLWMEP